MIVPGRPPFGLWELFWCIQTALSVAGGGGGSGGLEI